MAPSEVSNLPFHVASQALFTLADHADGVGSSLRAERQHDFTSG